MNIRLLALASSLLSLPAFSEAYALQAPDFTVSAKESRGVLEVKALPPKDHHFNIDAPKYFAWADGGERIQPSVPSEKAMVFKVPAPKFVQSGPGAGPKKFSVQIYLCDDKKTFCEKHVVQSAWTPASRSTVTGTVRIEEPAAASPSPSSLEKSPSRLPKGDKHGFILNEPERALAQAKSSKKPLMIDFYGIWCPPCNEFDEKVFPTAKFQKSAKRFVALKVDADAEISWQLKSKYKVGGYPTIIFADPNGDEIHRVVGFRPEAEFLPEMEKAWEKRDQGFSALQAKAKSGDREAMDRLGLIHLERRENALAAQYLTGTAHHGQESFQAEIGVLEAQSPAPREKLLAVLSESIAKHPKTPFSIEARRKKAELQGDAKDEAAKVATLKEAASVAEELARSPKLLKGLDYSAADLWGMAADLHETLGSASSAKQAWLNAAEEYKKKIKSPTERGYNLELAYALFKSGDAKAAEKIYQRLEKKYPNEFTFYYAHGRMLMDQKKAQPAHDLAQKAFKYSYGDNRLRAANLLAQTYQELGKKSEAKTFLKQVIDTTVLPESQDLRTHRYLKTLKTLEEKL